MNAIQKRLFEEARKKNPDMKMPAEAAPRGELTDSDMALLKQGVGDKSPRSVLAGGGGTASPDTDPSAPLTGSIVNYFEEKGFGFVRPEHGGRDVFFHVSRLSEAMPSELTPGTKVVYELGMDRTGKMAASSIRILRDQPPATPPATA